MAPYQLIVFDWDGTLMDSEARIVASMQGAFRTLDLDPPTPAAVRNVIGLGLDQAIATLLPGAHADQRQALMGPYRERFLGSEPTPTPLFDGAADLITDLHAAGHLLAVATGKSRAGLDKALRETGLGEWFHATRCADDTFSKPHPAMLLELMAQLGTAPAATLMVGDTEYDLEMARNAGVAAVAVGYGAHTPARLRALQPLTCAMSIAELRGWLVGQPVSAE